MSDPSPCPTCLPLRKWKDVRDELSVNMLTGGDQTRPQVDRICRTNIKVRNSSPAFSLSFACHPFVFFHATKLAGSHLSVHQTNPTVRVTLHSNQSAGDHPSCEGAQRHRRPLSFIPRRRARVLQHIRRDITFASARPVQHVYA